MNAHTAKRFCSAGRKLLIILCSFLLLCPCMAFNGTTKAFAKDTEEETDFTSVSVTLFDYGSDASGSWDTASVDLLNTNAARFGGGGIASGKTTGWGNFASTWESWDSVCLKDVNLFGTSEESCTIDGSVFKQVYTDVSFPMCYDKSTSRVWYDCSEYSAALNENNELVLGSVSSDNCFWPFGYQNYYFGMTVDADFYYPDADYIRENGYSFTFSGDDDFVLYLDNQIAIDLGGDHGTLSATVDFAKEIVYYRFATKLSMYVDSDTEGILHTSSAELSAMGLSSLADAYVTFEDLGLSFSNETVHKLKILYLERCAGSSVLKMDMNLLFTGDLCLQKENANSSVALDSTGYSLAGAVYGVYTDSACKNLYTTITTDEDGVAIATGLLIGDYYVKEISASPGYTLDAAVYPVTIDACTTTNVVSKEVPVLTSITLTNSWDDENRDGIRPEHLDVTLNGADGNTYETTLSEENGWTFTFTDLPLYYGGTEMEYTVTEAAPDGYTYEVTGTDEDFEIINSHAPATRTIPVTVIWNDENNCDGIRPDSITVTLTGSDGSRYTATLTGAEGWASAFTGLPAYYNQGTEIVYTIEEASEVSEYTYEIAETGDGFEITYTHEVTLETISPKTGSTYDPTGGSVTSLWAFGAVMAAGVALLLLKLWQLRAKKSLQ